MKTVTYIISVISVVAILITLLMLTNLLFIGNVDICRTTSASITSSPYIGIVQSGYVHWMTPTIKVAWKGQYTDIDESIIQECLFELEQSTGRRFDIVDSVTGKPDILITFNTPDHMGFPWENNWAGLTSIGWYPNGAIAPGSMIYISTISTLTDNERENCIKHELAHAMGAGHIDSTSSIMNPSITGLREYSSEDITLLNKIYS